MTFGGHKHSLLFFFAFTTFWNIFRKIAVTDLALIGNAKHFPEVVLPVYTSNVRASPASGLTLAITIYFNFHHFDRDVVAFH